MTQAPTNLSPDIPPSDIPPSDTAMGLVIGLLAPMFLAASAGDPSLARLAAIETVNAYRPRNQADLIAVAQIIACGLAALASLSRSVAEDISLPMTLRLRGNANALNRSAEQHRRALRQAEPPASGTRDDPAPTARDVTTPRQAAPERPAPTEAPATATTEQDHQAMWAVAMVHEAGEITATLPSLPPAERRAASIRAAALSSTANELLTGHPAPPPLRATSIPNTA